MTSSSGSAQPNFYLWGAWKNKTIKEPFLTKKVKGQLKKVVLGDAYIIALEENGKVQSWGRDNKNGCLGLGPDRKSADWPMPVANLQDKTVKDIQIGNSHVVALTNTGEVWTWGNNMKGQLGTGGDTDVVQHQPKKVDWIASEQIIQIAVVRNSTFALSTNGQVYAWGCNENNTLGLEDSSEEMKDRPVALTLLSEVRVRKLEIFENKTIIAHVRGSEGDDMFDDAEPVPGADDKDEADIDIFKGIDEMRKAMEKTQEWWNHLVNLKHGQPYDVPYDSQIGSDLTNVVSGSIKDDMDVDLAKLNRTELHLDNLVTMAVTELRRTTQMPGTRNVRFILCMFIDECRLRREKVQKLISARELVDAKRRTHEISAYSVTDFGANANEEIRKIIAVTKELQQMLDIVKNIQPKDLVTHELKITLMECLECKLQLHDTRVELLKAAEAKPSDPMLPALRIIKDRWNSLKHYSLYALYLENENGTRADFRDDDAHLSYLVKLSNEQIDQILQIDKDHIISHDTLVPALCYDLLRENAELRKMSNSYQLHVLMLHKGKNVSKENAGLASAAGADALTNG